MVIDALQWIGKTVAAAVAVLALLGAAMVLGIVGALQLADLVR